MRPRATVPVLRCECLDRDTATAAQRRSVCMEQIKKSFGSYPAPNAQWSRIHGVGSSLDGAEVNVSPRKRSGWAQSLFRGALLSSEGDQRLGRGEVKRCVRIGGSLLVVMKFAAVQKGPPCSSACTSRCTQSLRWKTVALPTKFTNGHATPEGTDDLWEGGDETSPKLRSVPP